MSGTLFNDGIAMVLEYLNTSEWNAAACVSHQWFVVALSPHCRTTALRLAKMRVNPGESAAFTLSHASTIQTFSSSQWSLRHCITDAHIECTLDAVPRLLTLLPHIRSLNIDPEGNPYTTASESTFAAGVTSGSSIFPASLTSLTIVSSVTAAIGYHYLPAGATPCLNAIPQSCIDWIATASSLTELDLGRILLSLDLTSLCSNVHLQSTLQKLKLFSRCWVDGDAMLSEQEEARCTKSVLTQVSRLSSLTELHLMEFHSRDHTTRNEMSTMPNLRRFVGDEIRISSFEFGFISRIMPALEWVPGFPSQECDVTHFVHFKKLKELKLWWVISVNGNDRATETEIATALCQLELPIEKIILWESPSLTSVESWRSLTEHFHSLHELEFYRVGDQMCAVLQIPELCQRLTHLTLRMCEFPHESEYSLLTHHDRLTQLTHLNIDTDLERNSRDFYDVFSRPSFIPTLRTMNVNYDDYHNRLIIVYDVDVRPIVNRCKLGEQGMPPLSRVVIAQSPAARLVGIELNPGPSSASNLFTDGIIRVYSYLRTCD